MATLLGYDTQTISDMECWKTEMKVTAYPRMAYLYDKLCGKFDKFKNSLEPKELRNFFTSVVDSVFCPAVLYVVRKATDSDFSEVEKFLSNPLLGVARKPERCSVDDMCCSMKDDKKSSVFLALLSGDRMTEECGEVIQMLKAQCENDKILQRLLFVFDEEVTSRSKMYNFVNTLVRSNPDASHSDECKGSRIFHRNDRMLLNFISRYLEDHVDKKISFLDSLCTMPFLRKDEQESREKVRVYLLDVFQSTQRKLHDLAQEVIVQQNRKAKCKTANMFLGSILPQYGVLVTKQALNKFCSESNIDMNTQESFETCCSSHRRYFMLEYLSGNSSSMFSGIVTGTIMSSRRNIYQPENLDAIVNQIITIIINNRQTISTELSNEIQYASRELRKFIETATVQIKEIHELFDKIVSERLYDDVHIGAQISLSRIPGLKSFGYWKGDFEVCVCEDEWKDKKNILLQELQDAIRGDQNAFNAGITIENVRFRSPQKSLEFHLYTAENGLECYGSVTLFARRTRDNRLVCFTCKHVVPRKNTIVNMFNDPCDHTEENGLRCNGVKHTGVCIHTHGVEDVNQLGDSFVDISCVSVQEPYPFDVSIPGPIPGRERVICRFDGTFRQRQKREVYKKGKDGRSVYGSYVGFQYLTPKENEEDKVMLGCSHDHSVNILFNDGPRKIDLIEETGNSGVSFGDRGHSGELVSFVSWNGNIYEVTPALVYLGRWPDRDKTYMCYRLHDALECLGQNNSHAHFSLEYDDDFQNIHPEDG